MGVKGVQNPCGWVIFYTSVRTYPYLFGSRSPLVCPFYNSHRTVLQAKVNEILFNNGIINLVLTSEIYLYGHKPLSVNDNHDLLLATLEFIVKSNRFANWSRALQHPPLFILIFRFINGCVCLCVNYFSYYFCYCIYVSPF